MKTTFAAVLVLCVCTRTAHSVVIDFEKFPGPDGALGTSDDIPIAAPSLFVGQPEQITDQFASLGILFLPNSPQPDMNEILNDSSFQRTAGSRQNLLSTLRDSYSFGPIEAFFTVPVYSITMAIGLGSADSVRPNKLEIFDSNSNLINSVIASDAFVTLNSLVPVDHFRVTATVSQNQAAIDDVTFFPIPEPTSLISVTSACVVMLYVSPRRRHRMTHWHNTGMKSSA